MPGAGKDPGNGNVFYHYYGGRGKQTNILCVHSFSIPTSICGVILPM